MPDRWVESEEVNMFWIGLGVGVFIGVFVGVFVTSLCVVAKRADEAMERREGSPSSADTFKS